MFEIPENILETFFENIRVVKKCQVEFKGNGALIKPHKDEEYYKPVIIVKDLNKLRESLINYLNIIVKFYEGASLRDHHNLSYFITKLLSNMTASDALDLASYIDKISYFFTNNHFAELDEYTLIDVQDNAKFYVKRVKEEVGLETPYILDFKMEVDGKIYDMPIVRYAFDKNNVCHLFAIQFGRFRDIKVQDINYKNVVNKINSGIKRYRNVSPSFVITFSLFLKLLQAYGVNKVVVPDFLFNRYRLYFKAKTEVRGNEVLMRILDNFLTLLQRMEYQFEFFEIDNYPNEIDSFTHITLKNN